MRSIRRSERIAVTLRVRGSQNIFASCAMRTSLVLAALGRRRRSRGRSSEGGRAITGEGGAVGGGRAQKKLAEAAARSEWARSTTSRTVTKHVPVNWPQPGSRSSRRSRSKPSARARESARGSLARTRQRAEQTSPGSAPAKGRLLPGGDVHPRRQTGREPSSTLHRCRSIRGEHKVAVVERAEDDRSFWCRPAPHKDPRRVELPLAPPPPATPAPAPPITPPPPPLAERAGGDLKAPPVATVGLGMGPRGARGLPWPGAGVAKGRWSSDVEKQCPDRRCTTPSLRGAGEQAQGTALGTVTFISSAVIVAAATVLWLVAPSRSSRAAA